MLELVGATTLALIVLAAAYVQGRKRKRSNFERIEVQPESVARLYLRHAQDVEAYWLHAELTNGKKLRLAPPWDVDAALARLAKVGLTLTANDAEKLAAQRSVPKHHPPATARNSRAARSLIGAT